MLRALALAKRGKTSPNPMVGAIIVKDGKIVGEGYHRRAGEAHAEVVALRQAGEQARGAAIYVTLEPCCHYGKTPPCTQAIIESGVTKVVAAIVDPNPKVAGRGIALLKSAGIETQVGLLEDKALKLNEVFIKYVKTGMPYVTLKLAMSLDGKTATRTGESKWISCEASRQVVHRLRKRCDAIVIGIGTALADNPSLTARIGKTTAYPTRVVVDSKARTPTDSNLFRQPKGETVVAVTSEAPRENLRNLENVGACVITVDDACGKVNLKSLFEQLAELGLTNLLMEGGGQLAASALSAGVVDKILVFIAPLIVGGEEARTAVEGLGIASMADALRIDGIRVRNVGCDILIEGYPCSQG